MKGLIDMNKKIFFKIFTSLLFFIFLNSLSSFSFAWGDPQIVSKITSAFESIKDWFLKIATPAAAVAVGTGVFMKKFSFGDEERLRTGKRIVRGSLFSYVFLLCIDLILSAIKLLVNR